MAIENENVVIPEELVIDGTTFKVKEVPALENFVKSIVTVVAKTEKDKLYPQIQRLENQIVSMKQAAQTQPINTPIQPPSVRTEEIKNQLNLENSKVEITPEVVANIVAKVFQDNIPGLLQQYTTPLAERVQNMEQNQIEAYRSKRLAELGDKVMPELVKGSTVEEIEHSITHSIALRQKYSPTQQQPQNPPAGDPNNNPHAQAPTDPIYRQDPAQYPVQHPSASMPRVPTPEERVVDLSKMSMEEFSKNRETLLRKLGSDVAYPQL